MEKTDMISIFSKLPDPRDPKKTTYPLIEVVFLTICSIISGIDHPTEMADFGNHILPWLRKYLPYANGIPAHDTIGRVFSLINPQDFFEAFLQWVPTLTDKLEGQQICIDGKTIRGSRDELKKGNAIHIVSAYAKEKGLVLGQIKADEKSNEITAIPQLLEHLDIAGCLVSIDAMGTQKAIADTIRRKEGDYLLALKGNQCNSHKDFKDFFDFVDEELAHGHEEAIAREYSMEYSEDIDKGHGRIEHRRLWKVEGIDWWQDSCKWKDVKCVMRIENTINTRNKTRTETRYYFSSADYSARDFIDKIRGHWGIENNLHWSLDVTFKEDQLRYRTGYAAENFNKVRHMAINLIKPLKSKERSKPSMKSCRMRSAYDAEFREKVLFQHIMR
ncbi:MAG: ISAs1 family transposase [gamma proteobacterium symbiont of Clathrolucina costata]